MKYCNKCGWIMEYKPRSHREYINKSIDKQNQRGYWDCPNCSSIKKTNKIGRRG